MGRKLVLTVLVGLLLLALAAPLFAQQGEAAAAGGSAPKGQWLLITAGFAMARSAGIIHGGEESYRELPGGQKQADFA